MSKEITVVHIQTALLVPITGQFIVDKLGIKPVRKEKRAMYWRTEDFTNICQALIQHITAARNADFSAISAQTAKKATPVESAPKLFDDADDADDAVGGEVEDFFA